VHRLPTPAGVLMDPRTRATIRRIETFGLTLDVWCFQTQMAEVIDVCRAFPNLTIIVNHIAGPIGIGPYRGRQDELFAAWSDGVRTLAALPNTFMKIGGLGMRFTGKDFHLGVDPPSSDRFSGVWRPYVDHCIQAFGPLRCMFESNFPVDKGMCSYPVLWNAYKKMSASYSTEERKAMLAGTAAQVYRITLDNR
jgi:predicted TIM-barrel fold metal-dependent hydrolase